MDSIPAGMTGIRRNAVIPVDSGLIPEDSGPIPEDSCRFRSFLQECKGEGKVLENWHAYFVAKIQ